MLNTFGRNTSADWLRHYKWTPSATCPCHGCPKAANSKDNNCSTTIDPDSDRVCEKYVAWFRSKWPVIRGLYGL